MPSFGQHNADLTRAINRIARAGSVGVKFSLHAEDEMDNDGFDHMDVMDCLKNGAAFGPEVHNGRLRANVIHRGLEIRVVVGGLDKVGEKWSRLKTMIVVTVMRNGNVH